MKLIKLISADSTSDDSSASVQSLQTDPEGESTSDMDSTVCRPSPNIHYEYDGYHLVENIVNQLLFLL